HKGLLKGRKAVCYSGFESQLEGAEIISEAVAVDGNIITSRGAGTAMKFALALVERAVSKAESDRQFRAVLCD
ncbi:MAG: DJ-1/PfpI family protein, partial [Ruminococcus sp.]|nr:DJ-1/PfpI family protein [Ruminococcus sp.]